jgi:hypothetical protein
MWAHDLQAWSAHFGFSIQRSISMRIGDWVPRFNVAVKRCEERPDTPAGDIVYRVKDIFTTRDGSWEPSGAEGSLPQWARDAYLRAHNAPDFFDDGGGDHHLFARILDLDGRPVVTSGLVKYWSDGFSQLGNPAYQNYVRMTPKEKSGWANQVIFNSFSPERGEHGAWCWCPDGPADVVVGGGMPFNWHVSYFAVWQAEHRTPVVAPIDGGGEPEVPVVAPPGVNIDDLRVAAWRQRGLSMESATAFAAYARRNLLGAPQTAEFALGALRVQGYAAGIVFAPIGQWADVGHISW